MKRRPPRRLDRPGSDMARLDFVRSLPCMLWGPDCQGRTEAHHAGRKPGIALKAADDTTVPLCRRHHQQRTDHTGVFKAMTREQLRELEAEWVGEITARYLGHGGRRSS